MSTKRSLKVIAGTPDRPLIIGNIKIQCYVLEDETRVLSQGGFLTAIGITNGSRPILVIRSSKNNVAESAGRQDSNPRDLALFCTAIDTMLLANNFNNAYKIGDKQAIDIRFATKIVGSWKGLSKRGLVTVGENGQEEAYSGDASPMRRALAFSKSIKDSKQTTGSFSDLIRRAADPGL